MALHQYIPVRLTRGEKPAKSLKELTGLITAQVLTEAEVHIEAKGHHEGRRQDLQGQGQAVRSRSTPSPSRTARFALQLEVENPRDVIPAGPFGGNFGGGPVAVERPDPDPACHRSSPASRSAPALPKGALQVKVQAAAQGAGPGAADPDPADSDWRRRYPPSPPVGSANGGANHAGLGAAR